MNATLILVFLVSTATGTKTEVIRHDFETLAECYRSVDEITTRALQSDTMTRKAMLQSTSCVEHTPTY